jgi:nucleosome assembly protein 1-like 1
VEAPADAMEKLKRVDAGCFAIEKETLVAVQKLERARDAKVKEALKERDAVLKEGEPKPGVGTPGVPSFWREALMNSALEAYTYDVDEPVLHALQNITCEWLDELGTTGFKLHFHFVENEFFTNTTLTKTYHTAAEDEFDPEELTCKKVDADVINWKPGKNVTVETAKPKKGKDGKSPKKPKEEPVDSLFRDFFWNLGAPHPFPEGLEVEEAEDSDEEDEEEDDAVARVMEEDYDTACLLRDRCIPHAFRYFTGEMADEMESDEESEEESDEEEDSDEDSDSS